MFEADDWTGTGILTYNLNVHSIDNPGAYQQEGYRLHKYEIIGGTDDGTTADDVAIFRYTDVLMMKAECNVRLGTADAGLPYVNAIRRRAGLADLTTLTLQDLDTEWLHEFIFEGQRRTVNIRFGTYYEPWWEKPETQLDQTRASRVFPIPANILTLNPKLQQNPDYAQ